MMPIIKIKELTQPNATIGLKLLVIKNAKQIVKIIADDKILNESSSIGFFNQNLRYKIWTVSSSNKPILITAVNAVITLIFILNT